MTTEAETARSIEALAYKYFPNGPWSEDKEELRDYHALMNASAMLLNIAAEQKI